MIFLDMDGVLCDFMGAALRVHDRLDLLDDYPPGCWNVFDPMGLTAAEFWKPIDDCGLSFWAELQPYPWAEALVELLESLDEVVIATSPSSAHFSAGGKVLWLQSHFAGRFATADRYMMGAQKHRLARHDALLVDDNEQNAARFVADGGAAVVVPQPWNSFNGPIYGNAAVKFEMVRRDVDRAWRKRCQKNALNASA